MLTFYKHPNDAWLEPIREKDESLFNGLKSIHSAIFLTDDILDGQATQIFAIDVLLQATIGCAKLAESGYLLNFMPILREIYRAEIINLCFYPKQLSIENELVEWRKRSSLLDLYFEGIRSIDESIDTPENRAWFEEFKEFVLIHDDCEDILSGIYEDLKNCRRNYVVLTRFGFDGYENWESKKTELNQAAQEIKSNLILRDPPSDSLRIFLCGRENNNA